MDLQILENKKKKEYEVKMNYDYVTLNKFQVNTVTSTAVLDPLHQEAA